MEDSLARKIDSILDLECGHPSGGGKVEDEKVIDNDHGHCQKSHHLIDILWRGRKMGRDRQTNRNRSMNRVFFPLSVVGPFFSNSANHIMRLWFSTPAGFRWDHKREKEKGIKTTWVHPNVSSIPTKKREARTNMSTHLIAKPGESGKSGPGLQPSERKTTDRIMAGVCGCVSQGGSELFSNHEKSTMRVASWGVEIVTTELVVWEGK